MADAETQRPVFSTTSLSTAERGWLPKMGIRLTIMTLDIIGIGGIAWLLTYSAHRDPWNLLGSVWSEPWGLITLSISFIWCFIVALVLVLRKRPVHPGCVVGIDLLLWMALLVTGFFAVFAILNAYDFGSGGIIYDYGSGGDTYILQDNGTWAWNASYYRSYYYGNSDSTNRTCDYYFTNCTEQDEYINNLWHDKGRITSVDELAVATQFLGVLLHFTLFVWGCVDVHRRRKTKTTDQARLIAEKIIQDMTASGQIVHAQNMTQPLLAPSSSGALRDGSSSTGRQTPIAAPPPAFQHHAPQQQHLAPANARAISPVSPVAEEPTRHDPDAIESAPRHL